MELREGIGEGLESNLRTGWTPSRPSRFICLVRRASNKFQRAKDGRLIQMSLPSPALPAPTLPGWEGVLRMRQMKRDKLLSLGGANCRSFLDIVGIAGS